MKKSITTRLMLTLVLTLCAWTTAGAYSLTTTTLEHGSVAFKVGGTPVTSANAGDVVTIVLKPEEGYVAGEPTATAYLTTGGMKARRRVPQLKDGVPVTLASSATPNTYTFTMPEKNVVVSVSFAEAYKLTKTTTSADHGSVALKVGGKTATTAAEGATVDIYVAPVETGYAVKSVTATVYMKTSDMMARRRAPATPALVGELELTKVDDTHWTFTMPASDVEVDVKYEFIVKTIEETWVQSIADQTYNGSELMPAVVVKDGETTLTLGTDYTVSYSNNIDAAASTDSPAPTVTITGIGNYTGTVSKTFTILTSEILAFATPFTGIYDAQSHGIYVNATEGVTVKYRTTDSGDYNLTENPTYTDVGTYTVYYKAIPANANYTPREGSATVTISARELTAATLTGTELVYTGSELTFDVATVTAGELTVPSGSYTVTDNKATDEGNYEATITGTGNFTGTVKAKYSILPGTVTNNQLFTISISPATYTYTGTAQTPTVTVLNKGTSATVDASNYTVTYSDNTNAGTAKVTVTANSGSGYYGTQTATFTINKAQLTVKAEDDVVFYGSTPTYIAYYTGFVNGETESVLSGTLVFNCSYVAPVSGVGTYIITPSGLTSNNYDISFGQGMLTVNKANAQVFNAPTANTLTYTGAAQALVSPGTATGGTMQYKVGTTGTWSTDVPTATAAGTYAVYYKVVGDANHNDVAEAGPINATIAMAQLIVKAKDLTVEYGATPTFDVTYKGFVTGEDAAVLGGTLSYDCGYTPGASDMGIYDITPGGLTALNYDIKFTAGTLTVTANTLTTPTIELSPASYTYSGNPCEPAVTVKDGSTVISPEEYTVSYSNNIDAAASTAENAPTVTITDNLGGNYTVNGTQTFTIAQALNAFTSQPTITGGAVGGTPNEPTGAAVRFGTIVYKYGTSASGPWETAENTTFTEGTWYVKGFVEATTNYTAAESNAVSFEVAEPAMALTGEPTAVDAALAYSGTAQTLFNEGTATGGTLKYKVTTTNSKPTTTTDFTAAIGQGTDVGTYYLWYYIDGGGVSTPVNDVAVTKTIGKRDISKTGYADNKYVTITTKDLTWTGSIISVSGVYDPIVLDTDPSSTPYTLKAVDYIVTVKKNGVSSEIKTEGRYTIIFTGTGNFEGTVTRTFDVMKDIDEFVSGITFDIPIQVDPQTGSLVPNITVYDEKEHTKLVKGVDYSVKYFESDADHSYDKSATEVADLSTLAQGKYWVTVTGLPPKYTGSVDKPFYVVNEYQAQAATATNPAIAFHVDVENPGTPDNSPKGKVNVGAATGTAIDAASQTVVIPATVSVGVADKTFIFDVAGIESGAFDGCSQLHYIDATAMTDYAPAKLDRQGNDGPFKGLPKQALVFLSGDSYHGGENYVYKTGTDQYYCNTLKIYDDLNAKQTGFDDATAAQWGFMNPYKFTAEKVVNTRVLNAKANGKQQGYSTCLPYALPVTNAFKAYTLEASKNNVVGFTEVTGTLAPMTPYVLIPSASGQLLSATNATVAKTYDGSTGTYEAPASLTKTSTAVSGQAQYTIKGTMQYLTGTTSMYIMQANNVWNQATASDWPGPCVLPMRVYIEASGAAPARLFSTFVKEIENGKWIMDNDEVYDLLGRRVDSSIFDSQSSIKRKGIYIVNGKKVAK